MTGSCLLEVMNTTLMQLEQELRRLDWWQLPHQQPSVAALSSTEPFCVDTLTFSAWLQWVYIPKMKLFIRQYAALPAASGLLPIAEEAWKGSVADTKKVLDIIRKLDDLVMNAH